MREFRPYGSVRGARSDARPYRDPKRILPPFMDPYQPDAVALRADRKIAIEVVSGSGRAAARLEGLRKLLSGHPGWELQVVYAPPRTRQTAIPAMSRERIEDHLRRIGTAFDAISPAAALLTAWAGFEAAARLVLPAELERPQSPQQLVELLAAEGSVTPDEADTLRRVGQIRNEAAHGRLDLTLTREELDKLLRITRTILAAPEQNGSAAAT